MIGNIIMAICYIIVYGLGFAGILMLGITAWALLTFSIPTLRRRFYKRDGLI